MSLETIGVLVLVIGAAVVGWLLFRGIRAFGRFLLVVGILGSVLAASAKGFHLLLLLVFVSVGIIPGVLILWLTRKRARGNWLLK